VAPSTDAIRALGAKCSGSSPSSSFVPAAVIANKGHSSICVAAITTHKAPCFERVEDGGHSRACDEEAIPAISCGG